MELQEKLRIRNQGSKQPVLAAGLTRADEKVIETILGERARFHRFLASRVGDQATAEDLLQDSLLRALEQSGKLRRGEAAVPWFFRILRHAISDHFRKKGSENRRVENLLADLQAGGDDVHTPPADWDTAVCACFHGLLPALKPRYAQVIRRIDLRGESKSEVARDLRINAATMDVLLHRARQALRRRLEVFCGSCSREHCLACLCKPRAAARKAEEGNG
jgi:RNA polymerase sigma factor (sigma-70 family)